MRRFLKSSLAVSAILVLAAWVIGPQLIDREALRNSLVDQLSTALGHPVDIGHVDVTLLPQPAVTLERIAAGLGATPDHTLHIGRIRVALSPQALLQRQISFTQIDIETLALNPGLLAALQQTAAALRAGTTNSGLDVRLQHAEIRDLLWTTADGLQLGPFTARLDWRGGTLPETLFIAQADGQLQARIRFSAAAIDVHIQAKEWTTPHHAPLQKAMQITQLESQLRYTDGQLQIIGAELTGPVGQLRLNGQLDWRTGWHFDGRLSGERVELPLLLASFGHAAFPGQVGGECALKLQAAHAENLVRQPGLDCVLRHTHADREAQLKLVTQADADALAYTVQAQNLTLPVGPALHFDRLDMSGKLAAGRLDFTAAQASGYQGQLALQGNLSWRSGWQGNFTASSRNLRLDSLLAVFEQHNLDGNLDADCQGKLAGETFNLLFRQPGLNCDFTLTQGVLHKADLEQSVRLLKTGSKTAGSTPFDHLSGRLQMRGGQTHFTGLKLRSSVLVAKGDVSISREQQLTGELNAGLKNTGGMVSVPLVVSGVVGDPIIRPTASAMAGGAAGTVLLGPGVGTAVGVKVGEAFSKMTGWLKPKPRTATTDTTTAE